MTRMHRRLARLAALAGLAALSLPAASQAKSGPALSFSPQTGGSFDYGVVAVGTHADQVFTLTNTGGSATASLAISLTGSGAFSKLADTCSGASLGPNKKCAVTVRYTGTAGNQTATLSSMSPKPAAAASVTLKGTGGAADVAISPATYDFGSSAGSKTFTATNNGNLAAAGYSFGGPTDSQHFDVTSNTCTGAALAPTASCSFTVGFTAPSACAAEPALYQDSVSLGSDASVTFEGEQPLCQPHLTLSPYLFQNALNDTLYQFNFSGSGSQTFTVTNDGKASLVGLNISGLPSSGGEITLDASSDSGDCQNVTTLGIGDSCTFTLTVVQPANLCPSENASDDAFINFYDSNLADGSRLLLETPVLCP